jgi:phage gp36-like protein
LSGNDFFREEYMKRFLFVLILISVLVIPAFSGIRASADTEGIMAYCTRVDLEEAYGEDRIAAWSRMEPNVVDRAIRNASSEIDGFLISGGYTVPLSGPPENLKKYCIDIAAANLILSCGVLDTDPGGKAIVDEAKNARQFLAKVAEGKYRIPGYVDRNTEVSHPPAGVRVSALPRLDLRAY